MYFDVSPAQIEAHAFEKQHAGPRQVGVPDIWLLLVDHMLDIAVGALP